MSQDSRFTEAQKRAYREGIEDGRSGQDHRHVYAWALEPIYVVGLDEGRNEQLRRDLGQEGERQRSLRTES